MITFGRFGHVEDKEKEKEIFLKYLNDLIYVMTLTVNNDKKK